jgi:hypothetical protein
MRCANLLDWYEAALSLTDIYKTLPGLTNLYRTLPAPMLKSSYCTQAIVDLTAQRGALMNCEKFKAICAKAIVAAIVTSGIFALGTQTASAQSIIATVPFAFSAGDQNFPAGTYQFTSLSEWSLSIRNVKGGGEKFFAVQPKQSGLRAHRDGIVIHNSEGRKNLEAVYLRESDMGSELLPHASASPKLRSPLQSAALR